MPTVDPGTLRQIPLFSNLSDLTLRDLTRGALLQRYPRRTTLFDQGEIPDFLHVLLDGEIQLVGSSSEGRESVIEVLRPVDAFITAAVLTSAPYLMKAQVLATARVLLIPAGGLRRRIASDPELALTLLATLSSQFRMMVRQVKNLKLRTSTQRLGCYLVELAREQGGAQEVVLPLDRKTLAERLGVARESLSRAFTALRSYGVEVDGNRVRLTNPDALRAWCRPDRLIDEVERNLTIPVD